MKIKYFDLLIIISSIVEDNVLYTIGNVMTQVLRDNDFGFMREVGE